MIYYIARFSDDHLILGDETSIDDKIREYAEGHPRATLVDPKARITKREYQTHVRGGSIHWLLMQGNPLKPLSDGKKELLARLVREQVGRNIP